MHIIKQKATQYYRELFEVDTNTMTDHEKPRDMVSQILAVTEMDYTDLAKRGVIGAMVARAVQSGSPRKTAAQDGLFTDMWQVAADANSTVCRMWALIIHVSLQKARSIESEGRRGAGQDAVRRQDDHNDKFPAQ